MSNLMLEDISPAHSSVDDAARKELLWEEREEQLVKKISNQCSISADRHTEKARQFKKMFVLLGLPAALLPLIAAAVGDIFKNEEDTGKYMQIALLASGVLSGIGTFFNFGKKLQVHFDTAGKYAELQLFIDTEMCKPRCMRMACDAFLVLATNKFSAINLQAPDA